MKVSSQDAKIDQKDKFNPVLHASRAMIDRVSSTFVSLKDILLRKTDKLYDDEAVEVYKMVPNSGDDDSQAQKTIIVKRMDFMFQEKECQIINITDLTAYIKLQKEENTTRLLKTLNASVHHELLTPVKTMIEISQRLIKKMSKYPQEKKMVKTLLLSSQFIMMHAHDFLDQQLIEHGSFAPHFDTGFLGDAISEIVEMMSYSVTKRDLSIKFDKSALENSPLMKFDKRRLQ